MANPLNPQEMARAAGWLLTIAGTITFIGGIVWVVCIVRIFRRDVKRSREGLCMRCGYDLRHSVDRCPECGEPIRK